MAQVRCQCRWLEYGLKLLLPPVLVSSPEMKIEASQSTRGQSPCSSPSSMQVNAALREPSYKKGGKARWWGPRRATVNAVFWCMCEKATNTPCQGAIW